MELLKFRSYFMMQYATTLQWHYGYVLQHTHSPHNFWVLMHAFQRSIQFMMALHHPVWTTYVIDTLCMTRYRSTKFINHSIRWKLIPLHLERDGSGAVEFNQLHFRIFSFNPISSELTMSLYQWKRYFRIVLSAYFMARCAGNCIYCWVWSYSQWYERMSENSHICKVKVLLWCWICSAKYRTICVYHYRYYNGLAN